MLRTEQAPQTVELSPIGTEEEFAAVVGEMVAGELPRVFALVEEYGERADGWIIAWGIAFADHAELVTVDCGARGGFRSAESARSAFARRRTVRLVWPASVR